MQHVSFDFTSREATKLKPFNLSQYQPYRSLQINNSLTSTWIFGKCFLNRKCYCLIFIQFTTPMDALCNFKHYYFYLYVDKQQVSPNKENLFTKNWSFWSTSKVCMHACFLKSTIIMQRLLLDREK